MSSNGLIFVSHTSSRCDGLGIESFHESAFAFENSQWKTVSDARTWTPLCICMLCGKYAKAVAILKPNQSLLLMTLEPARRDSSTGGTPLHMQLPAPFCMPLYNKQCAIVGLVVETNASNEVFVVRIARITAAKVRHLLSSWPTASIQESIGAYVVAALQTWGPCISTSYAHEHTGETLEPVPGVDHQSDDDDEDENDSDDPAICLQVGSGIDLDAPVGYVAKEGRHGSSASLKGNDRATLRFPSDTIEVLYIQLSRRHNYRPDFLEEYLTNATVANVDTQSDTEGPDYTISSGAAFTRTLTEDDTVSLPDAGHVAEGYKSHDDNDNDSDSEYSCHVKSRKPYNGADSCDSANDDDSQCMSDGSDINSRVTTPADSEEDEVFDGVGPVDDLDNDGDNENDSEGACDSDGDDDGDNS